MCGKILNRYAGCAYRYETAGGIAFVLIPIWQTSSHKGKQDSLFYQRAVAKGFKGGEIKGGGKQIGRELT